MIDEPSNKFLELESEDKLVIEEPICMYCGKVCDTVEFVYTGDEESVDGFEVWCYCDDCQVDTFHKIREKL